MCTTGGIINVTRPDGKHDVLRWATRRVTMTDATRLVGKKIKILAAEVPQRGFLYCFLPPIGSRAFTILRPIHW